MYHRYVIFVLGLLSCFTVRAQNSLQLLTEWKQRYPSEKIYFHLDRSNYQAGDTVWFKAYLSYDQLPDTLSTVLYTQLWNSSGKMVSEQVWPILFGTSHGQFELSDSTVAGEYMIKAWTAQLLNLSPQGAYRKYFGVRATLKSLSKTSVTAIEKSNFPTAPPLTKEPPIVRFFPEGGNLVEGVVNTVAFEALQGLQKPLTGQGCLKDETGMVVSKFTASRNGRGLLEWTPEKGKSYFVEFAGDSTASRFAIPSAISQGIAMTLLPQGQDWFFELRQGTSDPLFQPAYMVGLLGNEVVFTTALSGNKKKWQGVLKTAKLRSGILQITIFNKDEMPLAERLCFVNNKEYQTSVQLLTDTISFEPKARNYFRLSIADTIKGSLSVSVTDATYEDTVTAHDNIISTLLLTADCLERINHAGNYFDESVADASEELDLLLMTRGWRRFNWTKDSPAIQRGASHKDPGYITLEGVAYMKGTKKPFANKDLFVIMGSMARGQNTFITKTNEKGQFSIDSLLFQGTVRFYFMEPRGKKSQYIDIALAKDTVTILPHTSREGWVVDASEVNVVSTAYDASAVAMAEGDLLEEVTLEVRKKSPEQVVDERYSSGLFSGFATRTLDLVSSDQVITEPTIFDYLIARVPGLSFTANGPEYVLYYRQGPSASSLGPIPMTVFLNEVETDPSLIAAIPPNEIALVKVFGTFAGAFGNGAGGAMAIYTKKGADLTKSVARGDMVTYRGFTIRREFYAPDYSALHGSFLKNDKRKTLAWRPNVLINNSNPSVPISFYNNDTAKAFRVRAEGMTIDGKFIFMDQIIRVNKP